jgi:hypothetical protein
VTTDTAPLGDQLGPDRGEEGEGPSDEVMRAALRERGHNPTKRGRLGRDWVELYESGESITGAAVTDADFEPDHARQVEDRPAASATRAERPPAKPKARGWRNRIGLGDRAGKHDSGKPSAKRAAAPKHSAGPRVPLDRLGETVLDGAAALMRGVDPALSRTFALEAPIGGMMAEDALAGTWVDRVVLQKAARAQDKTRILAALFGMPAGIIMLEQAQSLPERQRLTREAIILRGLRECAVMWVEFAGDKLKEKAARDAQRGPLYEEADELLRFLLYGTPVAQGAGTAQDVADAWAAATSSPGDQAAADAQAQATPGGFGGFMAPPPAGYADRPAYAHPYPPVNPAAALVPRR